MARRPRAGGRTAHRFFLTGDGCTMGGSPNSSVPHDNRFPNMMEPLHAQGGKNATAKHVFTRRRQQRRRAQRRPSWRCTAAPHEQPPSPPAPTPTCLVHLRVQVILAAVGQVVLVHHGIQLLGRRGLLRLLLLRHVSPHSTARPSSPRTGLAPPLPLPPWRLLMPAAHSVSAPRLARCSARTHGPCFVCPALLGQPPDARGPTPGPLHLARLAHRPLAALAALASGLAARVFVPAKR